MNFRRNNQAAAPGFQIAPMIDIVFLLLCFFVTSQIFARWETEIEITVPTAETGKPPERLPGEIIINVFPDGSVRVNRRTLSRPETEALLRNLVRHFPGQPVIIRADKSTPYEHVVGVLDVCRRADIWNISFATGVPEKKSAAGE